MNKNSNSYVLILLPLLAIAACGSGLENPLAGQFEDNSAGGIWFGTRANGTEIVVFVNETGEFQMVDPFGNIGFGQLAVSQITEVALTYDLAPPFESTLFDGSESASCTATGTVIERVALNFETNCVSSLGTTFGGPVMLDYQPEYDRDSSQATIAGMYDESGNILTVDASGAFFEQDAQSGCVLNGQVSTFSTAWNLYDVSFTTENCGGTLATLNGAVWDGFATLLDDQGTDLLIGSFTTRVGSTTIALAIAATRI